MSKPLYPIPTFLFLLVTFTALLPQISCNNNAALTPTLRSTPQDFLFTLTFTGGKSPFTSLSDFTTNTQIVLDSSPAGISNAAVTFEALALDVDLTIFQIYLTTTAIPYGSVITISFTDFSTDNTRTNYIKGSVSLAIQPALATLTDKADLIKVVSKVDYVLEIVWTVLSVFNPYWLLYSDGKMYREMFDMFKRIHIQHEPFVTTFFRATDRRVSGLRLPNIFGILILGNDFASEWSLHPQNVLGYGDIDVDRIVDLKVHVNNSVHEYDSFPLFLDNFGSELTLLACNIILALIFEAVLRGLRWSHGPNAKDDDTVALKIFAIARHIMWNLLLLGIIGSSQSFSYYTFVQIQAFFSTNTNHNTISFAVCIAVAVLTLIAVIVYVIFATIEKVKNDQGGVKVLRFFDYGLGFYKSGRIFYPPLILLPILRTIVSGLLVLFVEDTPIAQTAVLLAISIGIIIAMVLVRPFAKLTYTVFIIIYEFITAIFLALLLVIAINDRDGKYNSNTREGLGVALIIFWLLIPILTILFCLFGLFEYYRQSQRPQQERSPQIKINKVFPETVVANEFAQQPPQFVVQQSTPEPENKPTGIGRIRNNNNNNKVAPAPQVETVNLQQQPQTLAPPVSIMKPKELTPEQQDTRKVKINEMLNQKGSIENTNRGANSEMDHLLNNDKRNTSIILKSSGHVGEEQGLLMDTQQPRTYNELNAPMRNGMGRRKFPFEPVELRLLPESHRAIDEKGFKNYVGYDN